MTQVKVLLAVSETGSFSSAGERLYLSQSSVSLYISSLERELGYQLFHRTNRGVTLTERGRLVVQYAQQIEQAVEAIKNLAIVDGKNLLGAVRIGALPHICNTVLMELQAQLEQYPDFTLTAQSMVGDQILEALDRREIHLGIIQTCDLDMNWFRRQLSRGNLRSGKLAEDRLMICVSDDHPLRQFETVTVKQLLEYPYLIFGNTPNPLIARLYEEQGKALEPVCAQELVSMRRYAAEHESFSLLPRRAIRHGNMNYVHKMNPLAVEGIDWHTDVVWVHSGEPLEPMDELLLQWLDNLYRQEDQELAEQYGADQ